MEHKKVVLNSNYAGSACNLRAIPETTKATKRPRKIDVERQDNLTVSVKTVVISPGFYPIRMLNRCLVILTTLIIFSDIRKNTEKSSCYKRKGYKNDSFFVHIFSYLNIPLSSYYTTNVSVMSLWCSSGWLYTGFTSYFSISIIEPE